MEQDDVLQYLIKAMRTWEWRDLQHYGYEVYLRRIMERFAGEIVHVSPEAVDAEVSRLSPIFFAAAWELCRRGILRPGVIEMGGQVTDEGQGGMGYSLTPFGREWLNSSESTLIPTHPSRFAQLVAPFKARYGPGFGQRAQEASLCYYTQAYLACCAMCGAAAESILLHLAIHKQPNEDEVLGLYRSANGRKKIEDLLVGQASGHLKEMLHRHTGLIKYWRDESAHGRASAIGEEEAYFGLLTLVRFAHFAEDNYDCLTT